MFGTRRLKLLGMSLIAAFAVGVLPAGSAAAEPPAPEGAAACADLTSEITKALTDITGALQGIPPDIGKVTGIVGKITGIATNLVALGCLPNPATAVPVPVPVAANEGLPLPGVPAVPPCAAPAAGLLSQLFGLLQNLLKTLGGALPDVVGLLGQVTGVQTTVTDLTKAAPGAASCLPVPVPVPVNQ
ncbi:hypothetical protein [Longispora albida]|uniref:hypothetical protein n=1 Tax=Longispora albida TaxID=203523 RepID=UPI00036C732A|nr:hypothetical protein [Longispora albida]